MESSDAVTLAAHESDDPAMKRRNTLLHFALAQLPEERPMVVATSTGEDQQVDAIVDAENEQGQAAAGGGASDGFAASGKGSSSLAARSMMARRLPLSRKPGAYPLPLHEVPPLLDDKEQSMISIAAAAVGVVEDTTSNLQQKPSHAALALSDDSEQATKKQLTAYQLRHLHMKLPADYYPGVNDVICGRGSCSYDSAGNVKFRQVVNMHLDNYQNESSRLGKSRIVSEVIDTIDKSGGKFVRCYTEDDGGDGRWWTISRAMIREKTSSAFRDGLASMYSSAAKNKSQRRSAKTKAQRLTKMKLRRMNLVEHQLHEGPGLGATPVVSAPGNIPRRLTTFEAPIFHQLANVQEPRETSLQQLKDDSSKKQQERHDANVVGPPPVTLIAMTAATVNMDHAELLMNRREEEQQESGNDGSSRHGGSEVASHPAASEHAIENTALTRAGEEQGEAEACPTGTPSNVDLLPPCDVPSSSSPQQRSPSPLSYNDRGEQGRGVDDAVIDNVRVQRTQVPPRAAAVTAEPMTLHEGYQLLASLEHHELQLRQIMEQQIRAVALQRQHLAALLLRKQESNN